MSTQQIDQIKATLESMGFVEDQDFHTHIEQGSSTMSISVSIELDPPRPIPEELVPFEMEDMDRFLWKGNYDGNFKTWAGINYELALSRYASSLQNKDPEYIELNRRVMSKDEIPTYEEWEIQKKAIWKRICSDPQIVAWEQDLKDNYI